MYQSKITKIIKKQRLAWGSVIDVVAQRIDVKFDGVAVAGVEMVGIPFGNRDKIRVVFFYETRKTFPVEVAVAVVPKNMEKKKEKKLVFWENWRKTKNFMKKKQKQKTKKYPFWLL